MLDGVIRLDFRATPRDAKGHDRAAANGWGSHDLQRHEHESEFIFMEGGGIITDGHSFATPRFMTNSKTYGWLNSVQAVAKMVAIGKGWTNYDVFVVR